jgi:Tfp pilus assembly protein PilP
VVAGPGGKTVLILHTQGTGAALAKNTPAPAPAKTVASTGRTPAVVKAPAVAKVADAKVPAAKPIAVAKAADSKASAAKPMAVKAEPKQPAKTVVAAKPAAVVGAPVKVAQAPKPTKPEEKKWAMSGKRDPFFSPVVQQSGSGCSTGKKCLDIGGINLRGVVKSDSGFIAVVTNNLNKAYFLRENDPVFNGYVVKITGDSVVFQETIQDKLGKSFTREVVKRIIAPAV